ncbi:required for excision 1-B domain-containing protein isoform X1 [Tachyglossus aculeatus]|uniref:required for excision 1-B domain-containing protein isoform X1 n=1 Tax=Tachyglossus aculeatus TaxID=9261 RepID=UPI0018F6F317|nr:required for excision 1-B domain-containing protein isoform X1 [Tachyglossus aculeatus]
MRPGQRRRGLEGWRRPPQRWRHLCGGWCCGSRTCRLSVPRPFSSSTKKQPELRDWWGRRWQSGAAGRYRQLVHEVTEVFVSISQEVLEIQDQLRGSRGHPDLAQHLTRLQDKERERLELTAAMQLARQRAREELGAEVLQEEEQELKNRIIKTMEAISEILQDLKYDSEETE